MEVRPRPRDPRIAVDHRFIHGHAETGRARDDQIAAFDFERRGQDLSGYTERQLTAYRREAVGFVFQIYNLMPSLTALENVALAAEIARAGRDPLVWDVEDSLGKRGVH